MGSSVGFPAISVNLITPDTIYTFVNGKVRTTKKDRITPDAKFHLGSNSKAITSFIAMHLAENNSISRKTNNKKLLNKHIRIATDELLHEKN